MAEAAVNYESVGGGVSYDALLKLPKAAPDTWPDAGNFDWIHPGTPAWQEFVHQLGVLSKC